MPACRAGGCNLPRRHRGRPQPVAVTVAHGEGGTRLKLVRAGEHDAGAWSKRGLTMARPATPVRDNPVRPGTADNPQRYSIPSRELSE